MLEPNWITLLSLSLLLSIPVGILTNILSSFIYKNLESRQQTRAVSLANKQLEELREEYLRIEKLRNNPQLFYATFASQTLHAISSLFLVLLILAVSLAFAIMASTQWQLGIWPYLLSVSIGAVFAYIGFNVVSRWTLDIYRVINFETYAPDARKRIEELEKQVENLRK
jgi:hypothetical protein